MARFVKFTFPISAYQPQALSEAYSEKELRKEYSRLRSVAQKRLKNFEGTEWTDTTVYRYNKGRYVTLKNIKNKQELVHLLSDVARFLTAEAGSVTGLKEIRKKALETWHAKPGYDWLNEGNYMAFTRFLEFAREFKKAPYLDRATEIYKAAEDQGVDPETIKKNFEWYWKNFDEENNKLPEPPKKKRGAKNGRKRNRKSR